MLGDSINIPDSLRRRDYSPSNVVRLTDNPDGASVRGEDLRDINITANRERGDEREQGKQGEEEDSRELVHDHSVRLFVSLWESSWGEHC